MTSVVMALSLDMEAMLAGWVRKGGNRHSAFSLSLSTPTTVNEEDTQSVEDEQLRARINDLEAEMRSKASELEAKASELAATKRAVRKAASAIAAVSRDGSVEREWAERLLLEANEQHAQAELALRIEDDVAKRIAAQAQAAALKLAAVEAAAELERVVERMQAERERALDEVSAELMAGVVSLVEGVNAAGIRPAERGTSPSIEQPAAVLSVPAQSMFDESRRSRESR